MKKKKIRVQAESGGGFIGLPAMVEERAKVTSSSTSTTSPTSSASSTDPYRGKREKVEEASLCCTTYSIGGEGGEGRFSLPLPGSCEIFASFGAASSTSCVCVCVCVEKGAGGNSFPSSACSEPVRVRPRVCRGDGAKMAQDTCL